VVHPTDSFGTALELMVESGLHHIYVINSARRPLGVLSQSDVLRVINACMPAEMAAAVSAAAPDPAAAAAPAAPGPAPTPTGEAAAIGGHPVAPSPSPSVHPDLVRDVSL
jgi:hypothetical protein